MGNSLTLALYLASRSRASRSRKRAREDAGFSAERLGEATQPRPDGPLIWFHTGKDRHALAVRELAWRMQRERQDLAFLLTTDAEGRKAPDRQVIWQYVPEESLPAVRRFLDHWRPDIGIWTETDLRPALISEAADRAMPLLLIDAQTARPDPQHWRWMRGMSASLMERFRTVLAGSAETDRALRQLGAHPGQIELAGFLEEGTPPLPCNEAERDTLAETLAARPVWLAAYLTAEECKLVMAAHQRAQRRAHRLLLILVPIDPGEGARCHDRLLAEGCRSALRSLGEEPDRDTQVYVADTLGEMGLWYRLAPITFLGQSLAGPGGGANPYEPAALGSAIIHGPNVRNFRRAFEKLGAVDATELVRNESELGEAVERLLSPDTAARKAHQAWSVSSAGAEVTDRIIELIFSELDMAEAP